VSDAQALAEIKRLVSLGRVRFTGHARDRMSERNVTARDVRSALLSATGAVWQSDRQNWRVEGGRDQDDDGLTVIVDVEADVIVVTLF
jgi:hypothetical protein